MPIKYNDIIIFNMLISQDLSIWFKFVFLNV